jgi:hypothetical protein
MTTLKYNCVLGKDFKLQSGGTVPWMMKYNTFIGYNNRINVRKLSPFYVTSPYVMWHPLSPRYPRGPIVYNLRSPTTSMFTVSFDDGSSNTIKIFIKQGNDKKVFNIIKSLNKSTNKRGTMNDGTSDIDHNITRVELVNFLNNASIKYK